MRRIVVLVFAVLLWLTGGVAGADTGGFVYLKVSEGSGFVNPNFAQQRDEAFAAGLLVGGFHFALPNRSSGAAQANHFSDTYTARTGRAPVIYTPTSWWSRCTANLGNFGGTNPLWATGDLTNLPHDWTVYAFWQDAAGDHFNGTRAELKEFARSG